MSEDTDKLLEVLEKIASGNVKRDEYTEWRKRAAREALPLARRLIEERDEARQERNDLALDVQGMAQRAGKAEEENKRLMLEFVQMRYEAYRLGWRPEAKE